MPFFEKRVTATVGTTRAAPAEARWKLQYGIIHHVEVGFYAGCVGLVHAAIYDDGHQIWPSSPDEDFTGEQYTIVFREHYPLIRAPYALRVVAWNEDTTYPHVVTFRVGILPEWVLVLPRPLQGIISWLFQRAQGM